MAEKVKEEEKEEKVEKEEKGAGTLMKFLKILLGIVFIGLGVWAIIAWWGDVLTLIKGGIGVLAILAGIVAIAIAGE